MNKKQTPKIKISTLLLLMIGMVMASSGVGWILTPPEHNPRLVFYFSLVAGFFYVLFFLGLSSFFGFEKLRLNRSILASALGGLIGGLQLFWGASIYLILVHPDYAIVVASIYIPATAILAYKKFREANLAAMINTARKKKGTQIHDFVFSVDAFPSGLSERAKQRLHAIIMYPIFGCFAVALAFSRSDWAYTIGSPLMGVGMFATVCVMLYGNFISFFYWLQYRKNRSAFSEFESWPREG